MLHAPCSMLYALPSLKRAERPSILLDIAASVKGERRKEGRKERKKERNREETETLSGKHRPSKPNQSEARLESSTKSPPNETKQHPNENREM